MENKLKTYKIIFHRNDERIFFNKINESSSRSGVRPLMRIGIISGDSENYILEVDLFEDELLILKLTVPGTYTELLKI